MEIPEFKFFVLPGKGNPNDDFFADYIQALYALSYAVRMSPKQGFAPKDYYEYTVYPLEGIWDISNEAKAKGIKEFNKDDLVFQLMIRQPRFVTDDFADDVIKRSIKKKPQLQQLLEKAEFRSITDGLSGQMMHLGPYDDEPASFKQMEDHVAEQGYRRTSLTHREIYLSDVRKVEPAKLKTVLRFQAEKL
ncbi:MAG: GyrI-like domain-containing protein [Spirochaetaceae bacterium]|nr:GyrI-like domain-containing protein [Spirochaetaceae bacterium]